jgi:hypothetical protein
MAFAIFLLHSRIVDGLADIRTPPNMRHVLSPYKGVFGISARGKFLDNVLSDCSFISCPSFRGVYAAVRFHGPDIPLTPLKKGKAYGLVYESD